MKCITYPPYLNKKEDALTEVRPILFRTESRDTWRLNDTHITTHLTFILPEVSYIKLAVRRITIGGSFFGSEAAGYLDAEAEA